MPRELIEGGFRGNTIASLMPENFANARPTSAWVELSSLGRSSQSVSDVNNSPAVWPLPKKLKPRMATTRSEEHTSELQSLMSISYAVFCLKKKKSQTPKYQHYNLKHD